MKSILLVLGVALVLHVQAEMDGVDSDVCMKRCVESPDSSMPMNEGMYRTQAMRCVGDCFDQMAQVLNAIADIMVPDMFRTTQEGSTRNSFDVREQVINMEVQMRKMKNFFSTPSSFWELLANSPALQPLFQQSSAATAPQGFASNTSILENMVQRIRDVLDRLIKGQQEVVQLLIGCANSTTTPATNATRVQPSTLLELVKPVVPVVVPVVDVPVKPVDDVAEPVDAPAS